MLPQPPQWPDHSAQPVQPTHNTQPPDGLPPALSRSRLTLAAVAIVSGVLIIALLCTLVLVLTNSARGTTAGNQTQTGQTQTGQAANAGNAQMATAASVANGTPASGGDSSGGGGGSGGGGAHPTPTPSDGSATPTPTAGIAVVGGGGLTFAPTVHQVISQATLSGASVGPVVATCPSGEIALSGGWAVAYNSGATIYRSARAGTGSWGVYVRHSSPLGVTTDVECLANGTGATIVERAAYTSVSPGFAGGATPSCNAGEVLVGGGFAFQNGLYLYYFAESSATKWEVRAFPLDDANSSANLNVYAECLTFANAHSSQTAYSGNLAVAEGARGGVTSKACPSGAYVSGGGFAYGDEAAFVYATWASGNGTTWTADLYANGGYDESLGSWAVCLGFS